MIFERHDALSHEQCESLISLFERHKNFQSQGKTIGGLNLEVKDCTEVLFSPEYHELSDMFAALQVGLGEYEERYPFLKTLNRYGQVENITFKRIILVRHIMVCTVRGQDSKHVLECWYGCFI